MVRLESMCQPFPQALYEACLTAAFLSLLCRPDTAPLHTPTSLGHLQDQELGASSQKAMLAHWQSLHRCVQMTNSILGCFAVGGEERRGQVSAYLSSVPSPEHPVAAASARGDLHCNMSWT